MALVDAASGSMSSIYAKNHYYSFEIPIYLSFRFNISENVRWNIDGGCYLGFGTGGTQKADTYTTTVNQLGQMVTTSYRYEWDYYNESRPLINAINNKDFGLLFGTGLLFNEHYKVGVTLRTGTKNVARDLGTLNPTVRNVSVDFKLGYQF